MEMRFSCPDLEFIFLIFVSGFFIIILVPDVPDTLCKLIPVAPFTNMV